MKITTIGTTAYKPKMLEHKIQMEKQGHEVKIPAFDDIAGDEIVVCNYNLAAIKWADEIHIFWDQRSVGTIFDFGMCYALGKKVKIIYLQTKTFAGLMAKYENIIIN